MAGYGHDCEFALSAKSCLSWIKLSLILNSGFQLLQKLRILAQMTGVDGIAVIQNLLRGKPTCYLRDSAKNNRQLST